MIIKPTKRNWRWLILIGALAATITGCTYVPATPVLPTVPPVEASLTALAVVVQRVRGQDSTSVPKDGSVDVQVDDRVVVQDQGRGLITFSDHLQVELLKGTDVLIPVARLEPDGSVFVTMQQAYGHSHTQVDQAAEARVEVDTEYATIKALVDNTDFVVCHAQELTCVAALSGEAQVEAGGKVVTVRGGEATYIYRGEPPQPAICADVAAVQAWLGEARGAETHAPLGKLVMGWPQQPCQQEQPAATEVPTATAHLPSATDMVQIKGGTYTIGRAAVDDNHVAPQQIPVQEFWIDRYEVTNAQYQAFVADTGHPAPPGDLGTDKQPVHGVTWEDAATYCAWVGKRLPGEAEWEVAARGPGVEPPIYPWGSNPGVGSTFPFDATYEVGTQPLNQSPFGVLDMAGNVWEWVGNPYAPVQEGYQVLRGGRYGLIRDSAYRQQARPDDQSFIAVAGLRCAADEVKGE